MLEVLYTKQADADLTDIYIHTIQNFGEAKAVEYCDGLSQAISLIAEQPEIGRVVPVRPGIRRHEHQKHTIFYKVQDEAIIIGRVLHSASDWSHHLD